MHDLRVASVQFQHAPGDKAENLARMRPFVEQAAARSVRLVVFPEMCVTGYWHIHRLARPEILGLAEPLPESRVLRTLLSWARDFDLSIGAGLIETDADGRLFNSYVVAMPDGGWACHRKLHCFIHPCFSSGDRYTVFELPDGTKAGILICWDNNLVENVRITALMGAEILIAPHQTGGCNSRSPHAMGRIDPELWERRQEDPLAIEAELRGPKGREWLLRWLPARAHDNGLFLIFSNGIGRDDDEVRTGNAMILDPYGRILTETNRAADDMVVADLEAGLLDRCTGRRWIRGRRPELYQPLVESRGNELAPYEARFSTDQTT